MLNEFQLDVLRWIAKDPPDGEATNPQRLSARALSARQLVKIKGRGPRWHAELTDAGQHYLEHGTYPPGHFAPERQPRPEPVPAAKQRQAPERATKVDAKVAPNLGVDLTVDSPAGKRRRGKRPLGDGLVAAGKADPYDEKILVTVKEAAWMLSLPESAIRQAVSDGDLDRLFIGMGTKNYRIVYGSLLAWVNSMPRESTRPWWAPSGRRR